MRTSSHGHLDLLGRPPAGLCTGDCVFYREAQLGSPLSEQIAQGGSRLEKIKILYIYMRHL